jgi:Tfp pilus assembly protein PilF
LSAIQEALERARRERERSCWAPRTFEAFEGPQPRRVNFRLLALGMVLLGMASGFFLGGLGPSTERLKGKGKLALEHWPWEWAASSGAPAPSGSTAYPTASKARPVTPSRETEEERIERARGMVKAQDTRGAEKELLGLLESGVRTREVLSLLAGLYVKELNKPHLAVELYTEALQKDPQNVSLMVNLGAAYLKAGRLGEAEEILARALKVEPNLVEAHYNMACVKSLKGEVEKAWSSLHRAVEINSEALEWAKGDPDLRPIWGKRALGSAP